MNKSIQGTLAAAMLVTLGASADTYKWIGTDATARFTDLANWTNETAEAMATTLPAADDIVKMTALAANPTITVEEGDAVSVLRLKLGGKTYSQWANLVVNGGSFSLLETNWDDWGENKSFLGWHNCAALTVNDGEVSLNHLYVGGQYGAGRLNVNGGTLIGAGAMRIGYFTEDESQLNVAGGTVNFKGPVEFGRAKVTQTGGTIRFDITDNTSTDRMPNIGTKKDQTAEWNLSGGSVVREQVRFWGYLDSYFSIGSEGTGVMRVSGSANLRCNDWLELGKNATGSGTLELNGGTTSVRTFKGGEGTSRVVFNGGILSPTAANATWFQDVGTLEVTGGAVISNDVAVTIALPLVSGQASDGGLVKKGTSTLTLSAANAFNGPVVIEAGTLALGCDDALPAGVAVTVRPGAAFATNGHAFTGVVSDTASGKTIVYGQGALPGAEKLGERILKTACGWYDAADGATMTVNESGQVTAWANKAAGGSAYNLKSQGGQTPSSLVADALNGKSALVIADTSGYQAERALSDWTATTPRTLMIVSRRDAGKAFYGLCVNNSGTTGAFAIEQNDWGTRSGTWDSAFEGTGKYRTVGNFTLAENTWETQVLTGDCRDGVCTLGGFKYNSSTKATTVLPDMTLAGDFGSGSSTKIKLNIGIDWGSHGWGAVAEAAVFDKVLSVQELAEVNAYLNRKWYGESGCLYEVENEAVELSDDSQLDLTDTAAAIGTLSGMGSVEGANALLTVGGVAPVCGDLTVNVPVAEPAEGEYVTLTITINPANGDCGTLVIPEGYDLSKIDLVVTGCDNLLAEDMPLFFKGKAGESLAPFHSVTTDAKRGLKLLYDTSTGEVRGRLKGGLVLILK